MMRPTHSILVPPSGASIWLFCAGSSHAQLEMPELYSLPALQGDAVHMHAQACFNLKCDAIRFVGGEFCGIEVTEEQCEYVQVYLDVIRSREGDQRFVEHGLALPEISEHLYGTLDSGVYDSLKRILYVDDLKYGFSSVPIERNGQLWIYTLALMYYLEKLGYKTNYAQMGIVQPRDFSNEQIKTKIVSNVQLKQWGKDVLTPAVKAAIDPDSPRTPGDQCKYCKAKITCPEYLSWCNHVIQPPFTMTDERIARVLKWEKTTKPLFEEVKGYGTEKLQRGFPISGCKLVKNRKNKQLRDKQECATELLHAGAKTDDIYKLPVIQSPAQLLKKVDKSLHHIIGKQIYTPEGGSTIALMDDNRHAVATSKEKFQNV